MATIENFILRFKVEGSNAVSGLKDDLKGLASNANPLGGSLGNLTSKLGLMGTAALAGAGAIAALGMRAVSIADQLQDVSNSSGIAASQLLELKQSMIAAGGNADSFVDTAKMMTIAVGQAMNGNKKFKDSFRELGVFITDSNGNLRDSGDILQDTIKALANIENPTIRAAKAVELLGEQASRIDWTNVRAGRDAVTDQQIAQLAKYSTAMKELRATIETGLLKAFGNLADAINKGGLVEGLAAAVEQMGYLIAYIPGLGKVAELADKARMNRLGERAGGGRGGQGGPTAAELEAYKSVTGGTGGFGGTDPKAMADSKLRIEQSLAQARLQNELLTANAIQAIEINKNFEIQKASAEIKAKEGISDQQIASETAAKIKEIRAKSDREVYEVRLDLMKKQFDEETKQQEEMTKRVQEIDKQRVAGYALVDSLKEQTTVLQENTNLSIIGAGLSDEDKNKQQQLLALKQQQRAEVEKLNQLQLAGLPPDERLRREQEINAEYEKRIVLIDKEAAARAAREQDFAAGFKETMRKYEESLTPLQKGKQVADSVFKSMDSALANFVDNGKFNFKDFANSVIRDLVLIELRSSAVNLFKTIGGALGFRAAGGPVTAGNPYIVGERGAELFVPSTSGTIVSNANLAGAGAGMGGSNVTYNINAVDAPSFKQLLSRDPSFLYAVTQQGAKSMPSTRR